MGFKSYLLLLLLALATGGRAADLFPHYAALKLVLAKAASVTDIYPDDPLYKELESVRELGIRAVPALILLFHETTEDRERANIISMIRGLKGNLAPAVPEVEALLAGNPDEWKGAGWIYYALEFIAKWDPPRGLALSRRAVQAKSEMVKAKSIQLLGELGTLADKKLLAAFVGVKTPGTLGGNSSLANYAIKSIAAIDARGAAKK